MDKSNTVDAQACKEPNDSQVEPNGDANQKPNKKFLEELRYTYIDDNHEKEFVCPICLTICCDPVITECGHYHCKTCLFGTDGTCSVCRSPWDKDKLNELDSPTDRALRNIFTRPKVQCKQCLTVVERGFNGDNFEKHYQEACYFDCRNKCGFKKVTRATVELHDQECPLMEVPCSAQDLGCKETAPRREIDGHEKSCVRVHLAAQLRSYRERIIQLESRCDAMNMQRQHGEAKIRHLELQTAALTNALLVKEVWTGTPTPNCTLSNGNLTCRKEGTLGHVLFMGSKGWKTGTHEWTVRLDNLDSDKSSGWAMIGVCTETSSRGEPSKCNSNGCYFFTQTGKLYSQNGDQARPLNPPIEYNYVKGAMIRIKLDCDARTMSISIANNLWRVLFTELPWAKLYPAVEIYYPGSTVTFIPK